MNHRKQRKLQTKPGHPSARLLVQDGFKATIAQPVPSIAAMLVIALVCLIVLTTAGRTAATEAQVIASLTTPIRDSLLPLTLLAQLRFILIPSRLSANSQG